VCDVTSQDGDVLIVGGLHKCNYCILFNILDIWPRWHWSCKCSFALVTSNISDDLVVRLLSHNF